MKAFCQNCSFQGWSRERMCVNLEFPWDPSVSLQGMYTKRNENLRPHRNLYVNVHSSIVHNNQKVERTQIPINEWMAGQNVVRPYNGTLLSNKKEWNSDTHTTVWMKLENMMLSERSPSPRATYSMIPLNEMSKTGKCTETESRLVVVRGWGCRDWRGLQMGTGFLFGAMKVF